MGVRSGNPNGMFYVFVIGIGIPVVPKAAASVDELWSEMIRFVNVDSIVGLWRGLFLILCEICWVVGWIIGVMSGRV
ncbi:hypothetical protein DFS34DRAFT_94913 [Phlyctochytrium arcticum]|nr:hypothetical protein DFS34DRAFT_94913 [Phlyctochytrium arcticum]